MKLVWAKGRNIKLGSLTRTYVVMKRLRYVRDVEHGMVETRVSFLRRSITYRRPA